eukprot:CAMPEP_0205890880 /NCGR_PEP_ID=MMETSP1083-20121108/21772_1 /ASSEMBLY_ACC=CAM_ASM_000430 /TAXON_ID=97485 /ORGANISM="Prymnesium parvum, Strain Texoma1" /LENGTH=150 /DNA_ID=CAMNT_0053255147 /DNA_START=340 /DNA_END=789 /DNA_ORIENTATION=-
MIERSHLELRCEAPALASKAHLKFPELRRADARRGHASYRRMCLRDISVRFEGAATGQQPGQSVGAAARCCAPSPAWSHGRASRRTKSTPLHPRRGLLGMSFPGGGGVEERTVSCAQLRELWAFAIADRRAQSFVEQRRSLLAELTQQQL